MKIAGPERYKLSFDAEEFVVSPSTPVAVRSIIRHPAGLSQVNHTLLVSTTLEFLTRRLRRVHFRSSLGCSPARLVLALFLQRFTTMTLYHSSLGRFETCSGKPIPTGLP